MGRAASPRRLRLAEFVLPPPSAAAQGARDQLVELRMKLVVRGQDLAIRQTAVAAAEVGDKPASLPNQNQPGGKVPELEVLLPEAVEAAGGHPGKIERGRA